MRKINKKILVAALSLLLVACAFVTVLSFTMAADGDGEDPTKTVEASPSFEVVTIYNIDRIVQNSNSGADPYFHIVEVSSSSNYSAMSGDNTSNVFTNYVFNGYKTITDQNMKEGMIDYKPFNTADMGTEAKIQDCVDAIAKADLIYVHNDSSNYFGKSSNDIPEMVKLQLCSAAVGDYVPFIIDGPIATQEIIVSNSTSYQDLVTKVFKKYGGKKFTRDWNPSTQTSVSDYFRHVDSMYSQIDGDTQKSKWTNVYGIEAYDVKANLPEPATSEEATEASEPAEGGEGGEGGETTPAEGEGGEATPAEGEGGEATPAEGESGETTPAEGESGEAADGETSEESTTEDPLNSIDREKPYVKVADKPASIGRILVINNTAADGAISTLLLNSGITPFTGQCILESDVEGAITVKDKDGKEVKLFEKTADNPPIYNDDNVKLYTVPETSGLYNAYISRNKHPDYMSFEYYASDDAALDTIDYSLYDIVIIEKEANLKTLSTANYDLLVAAMNGNQHIIYDTALINTGASTTVTVVNYGDNYDYVCGKVMTSTETGKYSNILVTNGTRMKAYMAANNKEAVKDIADIINYASYRGIGGGEGDSSNMYTVLEIQPAYPIDTKLAEKFGNVGGQNIKNLVDPLEKNSYKANMTFKDVSGRNKDLTVESNYVNTANKTWYYLRNQGVLTNATSDEISFDGTTSLTTFLEENRNITSDMLMNVTDYYAWTISKAKVAHATGLDYNKVNVVHMSTYEFNCTKKTLLDNFDAVYIGGNNAAIKSIAGYNKGISWDKQSGLAGLNIGTYNMYFVNGDTYDYNENYGKDQGSVGTFIGNDITELKYKELVSYKNAGMPVIIGKDAVAGLTATGAIDPKSNMYTFLKACETDHANDKKNVLWNYNYDDTVKIANAGGAYGETYEGYVTVFGGTEIEDYKGAKVTIDTNSVNEADLKETLKESSQRPKLVITSAPVQYKEGDKSSWITDHNLVWKYEAAGGKGFTARLIFDDNANSRFDDDVIVREDYGPSGTLSKKMDSDFFGVIYWKLEVENDAGLKASTTGCIKIAREYQPKIKVDVLQIMPDEAMTNDDNSEQSLFLCTECQQRRNILHGNVSPTTAGTKYTAHVYNSIAGDRRMDTNGYSTLSNTSAVENRIRNFITNATNPDSSNYIVSLPQYGASGVLSDGKTDEFEYVITNNLGIHDHRFGIVKYDSEKYYGADGITKGVDNWNTNWFNEVKNDFDVSINILTLDEFEDMVEYAEGLYSGDTSDIKTLRSQYEQAASEFEYAYKGMVKVINGVYKKPEQDGGLSTNERKALQKYMFNMNAFGLGVAPTESQKLEIQVKAASEVEKELPGATDEDKSKWIDKYVTEHLNDILYSNFETVLDPYAAAAPALDKYLNGLKGSAFGNVDAATTAIEIEYELSSETYDERPYYDMFSLLNTTNNSSGQVMTYCSLYAPWRDAKLYEQYFRKMYEYFRFISSVDDSGQLDLTQAYNCMLFGAARNFAGADIESDAAIDAIKRFVDNGGQAMLFYDTLTSSSTVNMTQKLGPYFGVNTYSEPEDTTGEGAVDESTSSETYEGTIQIKFGNPHYSTWDNGIYKTYTVDTAATEVIVNIDGGGNFNFINDGNGVTITDNKTSNEGNYGKHDITVKINSTNIPDWAKNNDFGTIYVNGKSIARFKDGSSVKFSNSVIKDTSSSGGGNSGGSSAPLAHNPNKLTYRTALGAETPGTSKSPQFNYLMYSKANATVESKTHPAKDLFDAALSNKVETNAADLNNEGIVTMYPFSIGSNLRISPTEESDFTINVADENLIVYYSLSGGTSGTISSPYVADPHDGSNNYFVYQYQPGGTGSGMVTYLGAGCTMITGTTKENNDERRFFINLILNTGRKSTKSTTLDVYDHSSEQNVSSSGNITASNFIQKDVEPDGNMYKMTIIEGRTPEFSAILNSDSSVEIAEVFAYYDLDYDVYTDDEYHDDGKHILFYNKKFNKSAPYSKTDNPWIASGYLMWVDKSTSIMSDSTVKDAFGNDITPSMLELKPEYLYNNEYTYIVIKVVDNKGKAHYKRIKIILKPELHDLT